VGLGLRGGNSRSRDLRNRVVFDHRGFGGRGGCMRRVVPVTPYSTVTDFARLRGLSTSVPRWTATW
jgi:hypothetical protein